MTAVMCAPSSVGAVNYAVSENSTGGLRSIAAAAGTDVASGKISETNINLINSGVVVAVRSHRRF